MHGVHGAFLIIEGAADVNKLTESRFQQHDNIT
jgi:hypothetical protein